MDIEEVEVWVSADQHERAAIVRRADGFFCIYRWPSFSEETPRDWLYQDPQLPELCAKPKGGIFGTVDDARRELLSIGTFKDAVRKN